LDVVMLGFNDWHQWEAGGFRTRCGSIARGLSALPELRRLLVVSTPHSLAMNATRALRGRLSGSADPRTTLRRFAVREVSPGVSTLEQTRLVPPGMMRRVDSGSADRATRRAIARACATLGMRDWILWVADPLMAQHIGQTGEALSVFDAIDDWTVHPQMEAVRPWAEAGYQAVRERADVVFTVSKALRERLGKGRADVHWVPNGVNAERFDVAGDTPRDLADHDGPILGYVGVIQERLDVELVSALARALPHALIVLVGPVCAPRHVEPLNALPNVLLLGERSATQVPAYISAFDVCLMPHVDDALTRSMDPLKIYEYLAAGKPIVASGVSEMDVPSDLVSRCTARDEFIANVAAFLEERATADEDPRSLPRKQFARSRSWDSRLDEMLGIVRACALERGVALS
jgi:glycosyltransferase involved in cell wall biosynthesis